MVNANGATLPANQVFTLCATGPSYPNTDTPGACRSIGVAGGQLIWNQLIPGLYTVVEQDAGTTWTVVVSGSPATVPLGGLATATVTNTYLPPALEVHKSSVPAEQPGATVKPGDLVTYTLAVRNTGQAVLTDVTVTDTVPSGTQYVDDSAAPPLATVPPPLVWRMPSLGVGQSFSVSFTVRVTPLPTTIVITNVGSVGSRQTPVTDTNLVILPFQPGAISLLSLAAVPLRNQTVAVRWTTGVELDTFGFDVYRSLDSTWAHAVKVTPQLILGQGSSQAGAAYEWIDTQVDLGATYWYWLVETELAGSQNEYGPVSARVTNTLANRLYLPLISNR